MISSLFIVIIVDCRLHFLCLSVCRSLSLSLSLSVLRVVMFVFFSVLFLLFYRYSSHSSRLID